MKLLAISLILISVSSLHSVGPHKQFDLTDEWQNTIRQAAPDTCPAPPAKPRKVLIFSLATGFLHWSIPHTEAVVSILGQKSGAYDSVMSNDIKQFLPKNLKKYDTVILNNNCPDRAERNLFRDVLIHKMDSYGEDYKSLPLAEREKLADKLFNSLMNYVENGGGLVLLHGAIANFAFNDDFSSMVGGSFDYHPKQQELVLNPVHPRHPLLKHFKGNPLLTYDEPYMFNRAYANLDFLPLLEMDVSSLASDKRYETIKSMPRYTAWIRPHGKGRVFYSSPSHNAQDFENPSLLQFMLAGIQYALGDLECPDRK